jgi:hypothetical protein
VNDELNLAAVTPATFEAHLETVFEIEDGADGPLALSLASVTRFPERPGSVRTEPFALLFVGPGAPRLTQGIHRLVHPDLGSMDVFLVPIGPQGSGLAYEAVFN